MRVRLEEAELWPYYDDWSGHGKPDYDIEIPDELFTKYEIARNKFFCVLNELQEFLGDS